MNAEDEEFNRIEREAKQRMEAVRATINNNDSPSTGSTDMSKAQQVFEAIMATKGHSEFAMSAKGKYLVPALQLRWSYFLMGWEMRGVTS
jgi:hypothetical protein